MYQKLKYTVVIGLFLAGITANAQVTIQSPYSKFGVGNLKGSLLPQYRAMGGISTGVFKNTYFNNINMQNPATYAGINAATLDIGTTGGFTELKNSSQTESSFNATLSHVAMAFPAVGLKGAFSFGIMPYSELGYDFKSTVKLGATADNQKTVDYLYKGEGGLTKAYLGFGRRFGDHFRIGVNAEYLFGNLSETRATQFVNDPAAMSSKMQDKNSVGGFNFSYGMQYDFRIDSKTAFVIGYSGSSASKINSTKSNVATRYSLDANGNENLILDTLSYTENSPASLKLPLVHNFGVSLQKNDRWLIGADYRMGKWSDFTIGNVKQNLQDTYGFSVGGQFTPDFSSINNYFKRVEYRVGFQYDKSYVQLSNQDIKQMAITFGLGMPLASYAQRGTFYKMNISAEVGKRGTLSNGLLQERYINFHLGFTLNDGSWLQRIRLD